MFSALRDETDREFTAGERGWGGLPVQVDKSFCTCSFVGTTRGV